MTLFDTRATWVPALAVFGSPAFYGFLFYSPIRAVVRTMIICLNVYIIYLEKQLRDMVFVSISFLKV